MLIYSNKFGSSEVFDEEGNYRGFLSAIDNDWYAVREFDLAASFRTKKEAKKWLEWTMTSEIAGKLPLIRWERNTYSNDDYWEYIHYQPEEHNPLLDILTDVAYDQGYSVHFDPFSDQCTKCQGLFDIDNFRIYVESNPSETFMATVLAHELAHLFDYKANRIPFLSTNYSRIATKKTLEYVAQAASFLVMSRFGYDITYYTNMYLHIHGPVKAFRQGRLDKRIEMVYDSIMDNLF